ncbi:hypothetical protein niasHT_021277 [Heterodera trifolii]|uniref:Uncharacterized protein n=1 Tax=Heterodera trifolii TaxID=157864 RepID=A0ABD2JNH2_9BILA
MPASPSLFLVVVLACLTKPASTLKCWLGNDVFGKKEQHCEPGTVVCSKANCLRKLDQIRVIGMGCEPNSSVCGLAYVDHKDSKCENFQCCRDDFCNGVPDRVDPGFRRPDWRSGVIGLHTPLGIGSIIFAMLLVAIFSGKAKINLQQLKIGTESG